VVEREVLVWAWEEEEFQRERCGLYMYFLFQLSLFYNSSSVASSEVWMKLRSIAFPTLRVEISTKQAPDRAVVCRMGANQIAVCHGGVTL
jgi:hypothetical protein